VVTTAPARSRVLVLSDSHLSPRAPEAARNWAAAASVAAGAALVVHAGDLTLNGAEDQADIGYARELLDGLPVPWAAVPGNHDIGDNPGPSAGPTVDEARLERWRAGIGPDYWAIDVGGCTVVGIDAQLFGWGLDPEQAQWDWLEQRMATQPADRPVVLICHKPITATPDEVAASPPHRFVPAPARRRLGHLLDGVRSPLVMSGHVHQYRVLDDSVRTHVWAPTTWAVLPEWAQTTIGVKRCGGLMLELGPDGPVVEFVDPNGLAQLTLGDDVPDPYHH
jgi:3',5'-cyclic AMP phosphodiesterase CpdA